MTAPGSTKKDALRKAAEGAFVQGQASRPIDLRAVEERTRQAASTAKSSGLRELRLARDAAKGDAAKGDAAKGEAAKPPRLP
jgi:hypothetical protein